MSHIVIVNSKLSSSTARFWKKYQPLISQYLPRSTLYIPESFNSPLKIAIQETDTIVFVGNDVFFNKQVNSLFHLFTENRGKNVLAFLPDSRKSALAFGLGLPTRLEEQLKLIKSNESIPMDLMRCHYINTHGFPASSLVLNDVLIGVPLLKSSLMIKSIFPWMRLSSLIASPKEQKRITVINEKQTVFQGEYVFAMMLLGRKITNGPKVRSKTRINLTKFGYYQLNNQSIKDLTAYLPKLFSQNFENKDPAIFHKNFSELEIKATGEENRIIADGIHLGRLPGSFVILPKATRVISPLIAIQVLKPWKGKLAHNKVPKPVSNR